MRRLIGATLLSLIMVAGTAAQVNEPIKEVPQELFKQIEIPKDDEFVISPTPTATPVQTPKSTAKPVAKAEVPKLRLDPEVSWYGPGFYGKRTACGKAYTKEILGVAHRSLPCGTKVTFGWEGKTVTVPVIDRGPYVNGRQWDLSGGLCVYLDHCFTGPIYFKVHK